MNILLHMVVVPVVPVKKDINRGHVYFMTYGFSCRLPSKYHQRKLQPELLCQLTKKCVYTHAREVDKYMYTVHVIP